MEQNLSSLRVFHVISGDLWAGAEAQAAALLTQLAREPGVTVHAALLNHGELERRLLAAGVGVSVLDEARLSAWRILRELRQLVRRFDPDVVHTHRFKENILGGLAARLEGRRASLRTVHGAQEFHLPWWRLDKRVLRDVDRFVGRHWQQYAVAVSGDLVERLRSDRPSLRLTVVHNGLDEASFDALREEHARDPQGSGHRVVFVGRLVPVKRVDLFLSIASRFAAGEGEGSGWRFRIIGDGPLRQELEERAARLGLGTRVEFLGFRRDANEVMARSDVLVFTSDHEGTPMAALEALAMGVPVVARAVGGLVEMLEGVEGCRLVDSDDPQALADAIERTVAAPSRHAVRLPPRYRIDTCAQAYLSLYRELAAGTPIPSRPSC